MQVCTSLQTDKHASTPPLSFFTGRMPFLPPNQQRQSTEGNKKLKRHKMCWHLDLRHTLTVPPFLFMCKTVMGGCVNILLRAILKSNYNFSISFTTLTSCSVPHTYKDTWQCYAGHVMWTCNVLPQNWLLHLSKPTTVPCGPDLQNILRFIVRLS